MSDALKIRHELGDLVLKTSARINHERLEGMIRDTLDEYLETSRIPASALHAEIKERAGSDYQTPGYLLRLYRLRADLTQAQLATQAGIRQHHVSEMEHNKRPIGKAAARTLAQLLDCDYRRLL